MSVRWTIRPIGVYPVPETRQRKSSPFRSTHSTAMRLLEREIDKLSDHWTVDAILEIDIRPQDLRNDGGLRANARPQGPRVVVSVETRHGPMQWPCDTYRDYVSNLYAIGLTLEKLRAIDRYGVTAHGEQYRGWTAIPASTGGGDPVARAWDVLITASFRDVVPSEQRTRDAALQIFREGARRVHPDAGGTSDEFDAIVRARDLILLATEGPR